MNPVFLLRMKKFVWKEVPDPNKCSWARGVDFRKVSIHTFTSDTCSSYWLRGQTRIYRTNLLS